MSYGMNSGMQGGNKIPQGYRQGQMQQYTPEQVQLFKQMFSQVGSGSYLSKLAGGDEGTFNQIEAPAFRQFNELLGGISSRFSGMGSTGARRSSGFQNATSSAASNFAQDLQSQRQALQRQAIMDLQGISSDLLEKRPYQNLLAPKQQKDSSSGWGGLVGAGLGGLGGFALGGPAGAFQGASLGYSVGSGF
jgi:hypothetical protein